VVVRDQLRRGSGNAEFGGLGWPKSQKTKCRQWGENAKKVRVVCPGRSLNSKRKWRSCGTIVARKI